MPRKNISMVRRTSNRGEKPQLSDNGNSGHACPLSPLTPSSKDTVKSYPSPLDEIRGKLYVLREDLDFDWEPSDSAVLKLLFSLRLSAALWSNISDCDEVYNYWEPLHLLLFGEGLQTWEYSPLYAISTAFLPSSFTMVMNMYAAAAFLEEKWFSAIFCTAISALVGWPFAAVLGLPIVVEMLIFRSKLKMFSYFTALAGIIVGGSLFSVDSYYYGKRVLVGSHCISFFLKTKDRFDTQMAHIL
ncbi:hypothetical protein RB195_018628 [Necator americanus]|uniref:Mannosyltransferase n=1 Tax=Necator americanus TaxID=51031 RepID=A0ABR1CEB2_NECAM